MILSYNEYYNPILIEFDELFETEYKVGDVIKLPETPKKDDIDVVMTDHAEDRAKTRYGKPVDIPVTKIETLVQKNKKELFKFKDKFKTFVISGLKSGLNVVGTLLKKAGHWVFKVITVMLKKDFHPYPEDKVIVSESYEVIGLTEPLNEEFKFIKKHNIKTTGHGIGFSEKEQKWYGWSHRAYAGFGIGSKVKAGDVAYEPSNKKEFIEHLKKCQYNPGYEKYEYIEEPKGIKMITHYTDKIPNPTMRNTSTEKFYNYPAKWGKGEYTVKTLDDAKEIAKKFSKSVS